VSFSNLTTKCFNEEDSEDNISCQQREGKDYQEIFGATPIKIVEKMTIEGFLGQTTCPLSFPMPLPVAFPPRVPHTDLPFYNFLDNEFLTDFLQSFRAFMDPIDLLHILLLRFQWTGEDHPTYPPKTLQAIQKKYAIL